MSHRLAAALAVCACVDLDPPATGHCTSSATGTHVRPL